MSEKKFSYNPDEIIKLIVIQFGSIENFAKRMGYTRANFYQGVKSQTAKFIGSLKDAGADLSSLDYGNSISSPSSKSERNQNILNNNVDVISILLNNIINQLSDYGNRIRKVEEFIELIKENKGKPIPSKKRL